MRRGQFVTVALQGDFAKPRPALIVQNDAFADLLNVLICPVTTDVREGVDLTRITIEPSADNGLRARSQVLADKVTSISRLKIGRVIGEIDIVDLAEVQLALRRILDLHRLTTAVPPRLCLRSHAMW